MRLLFRTQKHAKFHAFAALATVTLGLICGVTKMEWLAIIGFITMVIALEAINSAIEYLVDLVHPQWGDKAGQIKDLAAGAVLCAALGAAVGGAIIFTPYLTNMVSLP